MFPLPARPSSSLELRHAATDHAIFVVVPERRFLAIGGVGGPQGSDFAFAAAALRLTSELLGRRLRREGLPVPVRVAAVECLWAPPEPLAPADVPAAYADRSRWTWRQAIALPDGTTSADIDAAIDDGRQRAGRDVALIRELVLAEGFAAQILHAGPEDAEPDALGTLYAAIADEGLAPTGWLHTIALSPGGGGAPVDRRRVLIRQPVSRAEPAVSV